MTQLNTHAQIGDLVRSARERNGLTQNQLSERSGVSLRTIASLEAGTARNIGLDKFMGVLEALGMTLAVEGQATPHGKRDQDISHGDALAIIRGDAP